MAIGNLQQIIPAFFIGPNGQPLTPEQIAQRQEVAKSLLQQASDTSPNAGGWASVLAKGLQGGIAGYQQGRADDAAALNAKTDQANIEAGLGSIFGGGIAPASGIGGAFPSAVAQGASPTSGVATGTIPSNFNIGDNQDVIRQGIIETAKAIGADPLDLATAISYETAGTFNPTKAGPTTQWGQHRGLIQFGEPQAKQHGVDWNDPIGSQLGANGAIANYFRSSGFKPGMSGLDLYSTINAGAPGRYSASDANNGGAPGNVADKWNNQMRDHRAKALALLGVDSKDVTGAMLNGQQAIQAIAPIEQAANPYPEAGQIAPHDFTDNQTLSAAAGLPMQGIPSEQFDSRFNGQASAPMATEPEIQAPQQPQIDPRLAALNDQMLGGALSETGRNEVAQALTGYFPEAPSANGSLTAPQNNAMSQAPMQQQAGGVNPQIIASLLGPNSSPQARQVGALLIGQHQQQQAAMQAQQQAQRELAQRQQVAASMGIDPNAAMDAEAWKAAVAKANRDRSTVTVGNTVLDANTMQPIYEGTPENPTSVQEYEYGVRTPGYFERQESLKRAGANNVTTNVGGESDAYQKKFDESMGAATAKTFTDAMNAGDIARRSRINLDRISQLASSTPQGFEGATIRALGEYGIKTEGLDKVQAMESLISQMVPSQRPPGSGTISDADLALYKASLPRLINSPEGNSLILETLYAINDHDIAASDIAARVASREITPTEARKLMRQIPNPFDDWREKVDVMSGGSPSGSKTKTGVTWSFD